MCVCVCESSKSFYDKSIALFGIRRMYVFGVCTVLTNIESPYNSFLTDNNKVYGVFNRGIVFVSVCVHRRRTCRLQSRKEYHRADLQPTHSM